MTLDDWKVAFALEQKVAAFRADEENEFSSALPILSSIDDFDWRGLADWLEEEGKEEEAAGLRDWLPVKLNQHPAPTNGPASNRFRRSYHKDMTWDWHKTHNIAPGLFKNLKPDCSPDEEHPGYAEYADLLDAMLDYFRVSGATILQAEETL